MNPNDLSDTIRRRIVADLHLGKIKPGGRLPSLRDVAREMNVSIRAAARAYAQLEKEGLVSVRGRSGIYLVIPQSVDVSLEEPLDWYAEMLRDAWSRRLSVGDVQDLLTQLVNDPMRVACVESTEDHMQAFCSELEEDFALRTKSVRLTAEGACVGDQFMTLYDALSDVDFVVTTAFHASEVRLVADLLKKPVVVVSVNDTLVTALEDQLQQGPVTIIADDPLFIERFHTYLLESFSQDGADMRIALYEEVANNTVSLDGTTRLYTRAARKRMNQQAYHLLPPPIPFLSASAARKIVQCMLSAHGRRMLQAA